MLCPKCSGTLEPRISHNVEVDVCEDCGGIFLDRGELRKIIDGPEQVVLATGGAAVQDHVDGDRNVHDDGDRDDGQHTPRSSSRGASKKAKESKKKSKKKEKKRKKGWADMLEDVLDDVLDFD